MNFKTVKPQEQQGIRHPGEILARKMFKTNKLVSSLLDIVAISASVIVLYLVYTHAYTALTSL
jgi:hypothetical protein